MKIGMMNNPVEDVCKEIEWAGKKGFDFIDITFEMSAAPDKIDVKKIKGLLKKYNLGMIGHTPWWLPCADSFRELRDVSWNILNKELEILKQLNVKKLNIHYNRSQRYLGRKKIMDLNIELLKRLVKKAENYDVKVMIENGKEVPIDDFIEIFKAVHNLKFHLDVGHANMISEDATEYLLKKLSKRLVHVHFSDNNGREDTHGPLGTGTIDWKKIIALLKKYRYDGTITLEVFSQDRDYLLMSKEKLIRWWKEC